MAAIETRIRTELRADGRQVTGLIAPYGRPVQIGTRFTETFGPGSLEVPGGGGALHDGHPSETPHDIASMAVTPPGEFAEGSVDGTSGMLGRWQVPPGDRGDALLGGIRSGRRSALSAGFLPSPDDIWSPDRSQVTRRGSVLLHVAAVDRGAHPGAKVLEVRADAPYGDVEYADPGYLDADGNPPNPAMGKPGMKRYPIDAKHVMAAWSYISQEKNASRYSAEQLAAIKGRIRAAMDKHGHHVDHTEGRLTETRRLDGRTAWDAVMRRRTLIDAQERAYTTWAHISRDPEAAKDELYDRAMRSRMFR